MAHFETTFGVFRDSPFSWMGIPRHLLEDNHSSYSSAKADYDRFVEQLGLKVECGEDQ